MTRAQTKRARQRKAAQSRRPWAEPAHVPAGSCLVSQPSAYELSPVRKPEQTEWTEEEIWGKP